MRTVLTPRPAGELLFSRDDLKKLLLPLVAEQLLAVLIGMADTVMVASCGEASVSGVSLVDAINVLLIQMYSALATGGAVVTSQYLGKGDRDAAADSARQLNYVILLCSLVVSGLFLGFRGPLLRGLYGSIDTDVMQAAMTYFLLTALSLPFLAMYNASAALLRAMNNSRASMVVSTIMNLINVIGNAILIYGFGLGVLGAGLATLIARIVGTFLIKRALKSPACILPYPTLFPLRWQGGLVKKILSVGVPNGLENGLFQFGKLILVRMIATFGTVSIAANAVGNTLATIQVIPGSAIGLGMITVVGQCVGAKKYDQAKFYISRLMALAYALMSVENIVMLLCIGWVVKPFNLSPETEVLAVQVAAIHGLGSVFLWPMAFTFPNALRAAGDARYTMAVSVLSMLLLRVVLGYLMSSVFHMGLIGVWLAMEIDWFFRIIFFVRRYLNGKWMEKALV